MAAHRWTVRDATGAVLYDGTRLVNALAAYGSTDDVANVNRLFRDGRRLRLHSTTEQLDLFD